MPSSLPLDPDSRLQLRRVRGVVSRSDKSPCHHGLRSSSSGRSSSSSLASWSSVSVSYADSQARGPAAGAAGGARGGGSAGGIGIGCSVRKQVMVLLMVIFLPSVTTSSSIVLTLDDGNRIPPRRPDELMSKSSMAELCQTCHSEAVAPMASGPRAQKFDPKRL